MPKCIKFRALLNLKVILAKLQYLHEYSLARVWWVVGESFLSNNLHWNWEMNTKHSFLFRCSSGCLQQAQPQKKLISQSWAKEAMYSMSRHGTQLLWMCKKGANGHRCATRNTKQWHDGRCCMKGSVHSHAGVAVLNFCCACSWTVGSRITMTSRTKPCSRTALGYRWPEH